ncbi:MAG: cysteine hydrolase [Rhodobacteraceae bacterium]|nr:cysteine hydrolase [Paracoccaceae bacterium]
MRRDRVAHLVIDMQRVFAEPTGWHTPGLAAVLPVVARLADALPDRTVHTRFVVPPRAEAAPGVWARYYHRWAMMTGDRLDPALLDLVAPLAARTGPGSVFDKPGFSAFSAPGLAARLDELGAETLLLSGVETDVCVLATALAAVDRGHAVILVRDALASGDAQGHAAVLDLAARRFTGQIAVEPAAAIISALGAGP